MTHSPIEIRLHTKTPIRFRDGGVFIATADVFASTGRIDWYAPQILHDCLRGLSLLPHHDRDRNPRNADHALQEIARAIKIDKMLLTWHTAINYEFAGVLGPIEPSIQVYGNRDDKLPPGTENDELAEIYRSSSDAAACVANGRHRFDRIRRQISDFNLHETGIPKSRTRDCVPSQTGLRISTGHQNAIVSDYHPEPSREARRKESRIS